MYASFFVFSIEINRKLPKIISANDLIFCVYHRNHVITEVVKRNGFYRLLFVDFLNSTWVLQMNAKDYGLFEEKQNYGIYHRRDPALELLYAPFKMVG